MRIHSSNDQETYPINGFLDPKCMKIAHTPLFIFPRSYQIIFKFEPINTFQRQQDLDHLYDFQTIDFGSHIVFQNEAKILQTCLRNHKHSLQI